MSAVIAFSSASRTPIDPDYIDEPCSQDVNVRGAGHSNNVTYVNFLQAATPQTRLRMTRRGRRVLAIAVALPFVIAAFVAALNSGGAIATQETVTNEFSYVTISQGQSLWDIAKTIAPQADPRDVIAQIVTLNGLEGELQPGQKIAIPEGY